MQHLDLLDHDERLAGAGGALDDQRVNRVRLQRLWTRVEQPVLRLPVGGGGDVSGEQPAEVGH